MSFPRRLWLGFAYYFSWLLFGLCGLLLALACTPFLFVPQRERFGPAARCAMRVLLDFWLWWLRISGVVKISWLGFERPLPRGVVFAANHPSLVDAPFLLSRLPDTICIFKPALLRNPCIAPFAILSGYVPGDSGVGVIRLATARVTAGRSLLIFPEGTRTKAGSVLNPCKAGVALIARRAGAPVQLIHIRSGPLMGRKAHPWWKVPPLPGWWEFTLGELIPSDAAPTNLASIALLETRLRTHAEIG